MKKIITIITIVISLFAATLVVSSNNKVEAASPLFEVYFTEYMTGNEAFDNRTDFENYYNSAQQAVRIKLNVRSLTGGNLDIASLDLNFNGSGPFGNIMNVQSYSTEVDDGWSVTNVDHWDVTFNSSFISLAYESADRPGLNETITPGGTELATIYLGYNITDPSEVFSYDATFSDSSYYDINDNSTLRYADSFSMKSFEIGDATAEPTAELSNFELIGNSGTSYFNGPLTTTVTPNVTVSYQDSLSILDRIPTTVSPTATVTYSGASIPYESGDVLSINVSDTHGVTTVSETYNIELTVTPPKTENSLSDLTINKGEITPAFNPATLSYTVNLDYSQSDLRLTAAVDPEDLSTLNTAEYNETFPVGTTVREFIVTAEDGTTKTYTINIIRDVPSTDSSISELYVDGNLVVSSDGTSYNYTLGELDSNFNFKVVPTNEYANIEYKLATDATFNDLFSGVNTSSFGILNDELISFDIRITAQDGSYVDYNLEVNREPSTDTTLSNVDIIEGASTNTIPSDGGVYEYILSNSGQTQITVNTTIADYASVKILDAQGGAVTNGIIETSSLSEAVHNYQIVVTAQDGVTEEIYPLNIVKKSSAKEIITIEAQDKNNSYDPFVFADGDYTYDEATKTYSYKFDFQYTGVRFAIETSSLSSITGTGFIQTTDSNIGYFDVTLSDSSQSVVLTVEAEDGSTTQYTITFRKRVADDTNKLDDLQVDGVTIDGFSPTKFSNYNRIIVPGDTTSIYIEGIINADVNSTITYNGGTSQQINLTRGDVKVVQILVTAEDGTSNTYTIEIVAANENNAIDDIIFNNIIYTFDPASYTYNLSVPYSTTSTTITVTTPTGANSTVFGDGAKVLSVGNNTFKVYVESEAGIKGAEYTFNITRNTARTDKYLDSLTVGLHPLSPEFLPTVTEYNVRVDNSITEVLVSATVPDSNGSRIISGTGNYALNSGQTKTINIVVEAEDGTTQTYVINVLRANDVNTFDDITIDGIAYQASDFNASNELTLSSVPFSDKEINILINKTDEFSTITNSPSLNVSGNWILSEGANVFTFYVTSQAGTKGETYKIYVAQNQANSNNDLQSLEVLKDGVDLLTGVNEFDPSKLNYSIRVDNNTTEITINGSVDSVYRSTISGHTGNHLMSFETHVYTVTVTAEDGTKKDYNIQIIRKNDNNTITDIIFSGYESTAYDPGSFSYPLGTVPFTTDALDLEVLLEDSSAEIYVNNKLVSQSSTITLNEGLNTINIYVKSEYGTKGSVYSYTITRNTALTNADLLDLEVLVDGVDILVGGQTFDPNKLSYQLRVDKDVDQVNILASLDSANLSSKIGGGVKPILDGSNIFSIEVTAEDGTTTKVYSIEIIRASDNYAINDIVFNGYGAIVYSPVQYTYSLGIVPFSTSSLDLNVLLDDSTASIYVNNKLVSQSSTINLIEGVNTIEIYAKSEYGTKGDVYTYTITRNSAQTNAELSDLEVLVGTEDLLVGDMVFNPSTQTYTLRVDRDVTSVKINAYLNSAHQSTYTGNTGNNPLALGLNTFKVTVTAEDGVTKNTYMIEITRANDNNNITDITVDGQSISFDPSTPLYDLPDVDFTKTSINFGVLLEDINASVNIEGVQPLVDGLNTFTIQATSEFGTVGTTYTINVYKQAAKTDNLLENLELLVDGVNVLTGDQAFIDTKNSYEIRIDNNISEVMLNASVLAEDRSTVSGTGLKTLSTSSQTLSVTVTAENGDENVYNITIIRKNDNNTINDITFNGFESIVYSSTNYTYGLGTVPFSISSLDLSVLLADTSASLYVNNKLVSSSSTVSLVEGENTIEIYATSEYGTKGDVYTYTITRNTAQTTADLSDLEVLVGTEDLLVGDMAFDPATQTYTIRVDRGVTSVKINAYLDPSHQSTFTGDTGSNPLSLGSNSFRITVTAEDGVTKNTYKVDITRANDNNNITDITVDGQSIGFNTGQTIYNLPDVDFTKTSIDFGVLLEDTYATVNLEGVQSLVDGMNTFTIQATSEFGTVGTTYTFNVYKQAANTENLLDGLELMVDGVNVLIGDQVFIDTKNNYEIRINNDITEVEIFASAPIGDRSSITGDGLKTLSTSTQTLSVTVTAENGDENVYNITIIRKNDNNTIDNITFNGFESIVYDGTQYLYSLGNVSFSVDTLDLNVLLADSSASLYVNNKLVSPSSTVSLIEGENTIEIYAMSEYGTKGDVYTYTITRNTAQTIAELSGLEVLVGTEDILVGANSFNPLTLVYSLRVDRSVTSIGINALLDSTHQSTYTGDTGNNPLSLGTNSFRITVTAEDGVTKNTYLIEVVRANDNNTITDISVDGQVIVFDPSQTEYSLDPVTYDVSEINLSVLLEDTYASVNINGVQTLSEGINTFEIYATSEYGTVGQTYTIIIEKYAANSDNLLDDLQILVDGNNLLTGDQTFDPLTNIYTLRVDNDVTEINILASVLASDRSSLTSSQVGVKSLIAGTQNSFRVTVTAEDGTENIYEINISSENNNYNISDIIVDGFETVIFDSAQTAYPLGSVANSINSIDFNVLLEDSSATIRINGKVVSANSNHLLTQGLNTFVIQVESEFGEMGPEYTYTVTKEEAQTVADLSDLEVIVDGNNLLIGDLEFDPNTLSYIIRVDRDVDMVQINPFVDASTNATFNGQYGSRPLDIGENKFEIHVTAEDKVTSKTYSVKIYRNNDNSNITDIQIDGITIPGFGPSTIDYQIVPFQFDKKQVVITATTEDEFATVYGTGTITLVDGVLVVEVYAKSDFGTKGQTYTIELERNVAYSDTGLQDLVVYDDQGNPLSFEEGLYNKNISGYTIKLDSESSLTSINIDAILLNTDKQSITGDTGVQSLTINGDGTINQTFSITVETESGDQKTYSITVLKGTNLSSDATINRVTLTDNDGNSYLTFNALEALQGDVVLDYQTSIINLTVTPNDQNATVIGNGSFTINADKTVTLKFQVIAQDGTTSSLEYSVNIHRQAPSSDNTLSDLKVLNDGVDLLIDNNAFSSTKYTYTLKVDRSVQLLDIQALANHSGAMVTGDINQVNLAAGLQQLKIFVTAEDGTQRTYHINIEVVNSEIEIISLSVDNYNIAYDPIKTQYDLGDISSSVETLNIKAIIPSTSYGSLSGDIGEVTLNYGLNIFTVTATSEDQSETVTYQIIANRLEPDSNNYLSDLYVTDGTYRLPFTDAVFNKETNFYQIILDKTSKVEAIEIFATAENGTSPSGTGRFLLTSVAGVIHNDFYVTVTAENGEERTYQIQVIKSDSSELSPDTEINDVVISTSENDYQVNFDGDIIKQEPIILDYRESSFYVDITAHNRASIYGNTLYKIQPGETKTVEFYVEAENGDLSVVYSIDVTRPLPDSNNLAERLYLLIDGQTIDLDVNENYHIIDIADTIGTIGIEADITDSQTITGTGSKVITKDNQKFYVVITAEDGTPNVYTIEINQQSDDATLKSIMINGVERFGYFKGNLFVIEDVLYEVGTLDVFATASHPNTIVTGNGTHVLEVGRNIIEVYGTSELGTKGDVYQIEITRGAASSDATLSSISIKDNKTLEDIVFTPVFDSTRLKYTVALTLSDSIDEILIDAQANSEFIQSIEGQGVYTLKAASAQTTEIFTIKVKAEDGSVLTYEIHVTREVNPEDDITIDQMSLFGESINYLGTSNQALDAFTVSQTSYEITVPYHLNTVHLSLINLNGASVIGTGTHTLNEETTIIEFYLTSKSGNATSDTYTVTITKEAASTDHSLEGIYVDGDLIDGFDPETYLYEMVVSYEDVSSIHVEALANHPQANVIGDLGDVDLQAGTNTINIRVVAEDGSIVTYKLLVSRLSTDADLDDLFVYGHDLNYTFDETRIRYELTVPYTTEYVEIGAVANPLAKIINTGIQYLDVGENAYEVYAISESGLKGRVYEVYITRAEVSSDSTLKSLTIRDAVTNDIIQYGPVFKPGTTEYVIILDGTSSIDSLMIEGIANDEFASVGGNGYKVLKAKVDGDYHNIFEVTVRAQDLSTTTYTISVYKDVNLSDSTQMNEVSLTGSNGVVYLGTENATIQFSPNIYYYEISVPYDLNSMTLDIKTGTASPYGIGTKTFTDNQITFEAYVVSQSGQNYTQEYTIVITREQAVVDNELSDILINGDSIENFDSDKTYYEIDIPYLSTDKVIISGETKDSTSKLSGDLGTYDLEEGKNVYTMNVTAQNGEVKSYTVVINYLNANAFLEQLQVINPETEKSYPFTFNPETFEYTVNIGKDDLEVVLSGRAQDQNNAAIIGLGRYQVSDHGSTAVINVIASDNKTTLTYTVNIVREEMPSNNSKLKSLSVGGQNLAFNPDTMEYELTVNGSVNDLDILTETDCPEAVVNIKGNHQISEGKNVVLIEVQAEDGSQSIYQLAVHKDAQPDNFLTMLLIISLLVWIITILVILIKSQREKRHYKKSMIK